MTTLCDSRRYTNEIDIHLPATHSRSGKMLADPGYTVSEIELETTRHERTDFTEISETPHHVHHDSDSHINSTHDHGQVFRC